MSSTRDGANPLRPYYRPPSIGRPQDTPAASSSVHGPRYGSAASYASSARDIFSDVDYSDYFSEASPSTIESVQNMLNDCLYKYFSILLSQPFDIAKTVLQVRSPGRSESVPNSMQIQSPSSSQRNAGFSDYQDLYGSDSDPDEPAYFTSPTISPHLYTTSRPRRRHSDRSLSPTSPKQTTPSHKLILKKNDSVLEVIGQEWTKEGAWGVWKGSNTTFVYSFLLKTLESWSSGLLSALINVPDPGTVAGLGAVSDLVDTSYPWSSFGVAVAAAVAASLVLAPLDLVRTRLILTPISEPRRSLSQNLRALPSYVCPAPLMVPTILHSLVDPAMSHCTPILLRSHLSIDPVLTPTTYSLCKFMSRTLELFLRLPLETVLRRCQMSVLASDAYTMEGQRKLLTTVEIGPYKGIVGTMWSIMREEGIPNLESLAEANTKSGSGRKKLGKKGQGVEGLWRGWRVGMWGLVGMWGAGALGGNGNSGGEF